MRHPAPFAAAAAALWSAAAAPAQAQEMTLGEFEYRNSCVACHGTGGAGDGPLAPYLSVETLPQLTQLQKNNGGVFPVERVYNVIDGTADVRLHGNRDMPVWGQRYRDRLSLGPDDYFDPDATDAYVRTRILALIEYLSSIQEE